MIGYYNMGRRLCKWWKCCFAYLLECSCWMPTSCITTNFLAAATRGVATFFPSIWKLLISSSVQLRLNKRLQGVQYLKIIKELIDSMLSWGTGLCMQKTKWNALLNLTRQEMHHESRIKCCKCNAHLCIDEVGSALLVSPPSHKGLVTRSRNAWPWLKKTSVANQNRERFIT